MCFITRISDLSALAQAEKRRNCQIEMAVADQVGHFLIEECDEQRCDMCAIDVGIGHDDDAIIAQIVFSIILARTTAECLHKITYLLVCR